MPLYVCAVCGALDNTASGVYWQARLAGEPVRCTLCVTGRWHDEFPRRQYTDADGWMQPETRIVMNLNVRRS